LRPYGVTPSNSIIALETYLDARLAYTVAMFNTCLKLFHGLNPEESIFKMSIAEFSLYSPFLPLRAISNMFLSTKNVH
jgi:hypothetical protein